MSKTKHLKMAMGFAVYRPDGTVQNVFAQAMRVTADQRAHLLAWAFRDDSNDPSHPRDVSMSGDAAAAKKAGYLVGRVTIKPSR